MLSLDFDRKMLLLATRMAHESHMNQLLLTVLEALLRTLKHGENLEADIEASTLIRCIIRIVTSLLNESDSNQSVACFLGTTELSSDILILLSGPCLFHPWLSISKRVRCF